MRSFVLLVLLVVPACTRPESNVCTDDRDCLNGFACVVDTCQRREDAGGTDAADATLLDTGAPLDAPVAADVPEGTDAAAADGGATLVRGDFSCLGTRTLGDPTMPQSGSVAPSMGFTYSDVRLARGITDTAMCTTCGGPMFTFGLGETVSASALVTDDMSNTLFQRWVGLPWQLPTGSFSLPAVSEAQLVVSADAVGVVGSGPLTAALAQVLDCANQPVEHARLSILVAGTGEVTGVVPHGYSGDGGTFDPSLTATGPDGQFFAAVPSEALGGLGGSVRVEVWGQRTAGVEERLACEEVPLGFDAFTLALLGPMRSDYAAGSPCL